MNRRNFMTSAALVSTAALLRAQAAQSDQPVTHVDSKTNGPALESKVVDTSRLPAEGAAPGAKAYVDFNGPTAQLAALTSGLVTLEPGAKPHPPHRHVEEEIMIVGEGSGEFSINGVATQVKQGDMVFAESNMLHGVLNTGKTRMTFYFVKILGKNAS
jgi:quercetin dioxygenase-like cupin family protein